MSANKDELVIDELLRNNPKQDHPDGEFQRFFSFEKGINNSSGFRVVAKSGRGRKRGRKSATELAFVVLVTSFEKSEWPDSLDLETGHFVYYGDNKSPGTETNNTSLKGNVLLDEIYELLHASERESIPPLLIFQKLSIDGKAHMKFLGVAAPGAEGLTASDDLVSVWRIKDKSRFTNKKARMTVLKIGSVGRAWLTDLVSGIRSAESLHCPAAWRRWVQSGIYEALEAHRARVPREKQEQMPQGDVEKEILRTLFEELSDREFEYAAAELVKLMDERFVELEVTPRSRDGGRDVVGHYKVGHDLHQLKLSVLVEAKKWDPAYGVGVKPMSRLISRIKHRDMGVFVTTSYFESQVQEELIDDNHPVLLVSGGDIARLLATKGFAEGELNKWIQQVRERVDEPATANHGSYPEAAEMVLRLLKVAEKPERRYGESN